ncbi:MAG: hypothetical protein UX88_C0002G0019 [Candidatus Woesebacteria bacterium GW2011_GWC2_47_16]|uniref:SpoVT-AbrB domain-containing protein n=8 Tax=Candidatus Woeseibacteriota TaxID=1752722 RepID=A0A0G1UZ14_9BACT|nr:MAG: hypothetical protein UX03_C0001G0023 [Candidatus Woesebacteria bacterium GW2011_GWE1_45_18]KKU25101.1 MAG: hypothetical protein UX34_C0003G0026 [Candidatus Woesebacteria bacterium GW2011_GWF1_46_13]KKU65318.1 MAG: hypothetical protein UX88_C0002G0019 [Candidatus Woesebacteria bacterium GW2011_GWC2_47_16]KKU71263.1 MAG: hypothetical protein UX95_C0001G0026 [Candidatus Woesebacteria bacterium GW2011_GWD1_47_21]OGM77299.1 MAG: hypothetical protein A2197_02545 [Candidatus Woesebacteria bact
MQIQTVFRAGNSSVVAIPKDLAKELKIKVGQRVIVEKTQDDTLQIRKAIKRSQKTPQQSEFKRWWKTFLKDNSEILDELAVR